MYYAVFNVQSTNSVVQLTTKNNNEAAGLMYKWWPLIDKSDDPGFMRDPLSNMPDKRIPVYFDGEIATDNETRTTASGSTSRIRTTFPCCIRMACG